MNADVETTLLRQYALARQDAPGISGRGNVGHVTAANFLAISSDGGTRDSKDITGGSRDEEEVMATCSSGNT